MASLNEPWIPSSRIASQQVAGAALDVAGDVAGSPALSRRLLTELTRVRRFPPRTPGWTSFRLGASARVALALTAAVTVGVLLFLAVSYTLLSRQAARDMELSLTTEAYAFAAALDGVSGEGPEDIMAAARNYWSGIMGGTQALFALRLADGTTASSSPSTLAEATGLFLEPGLARSVEQVVTPSKGAIRTVNIGGEDFKVAAFPVIDDAGNVLAEAVAALPTRSLGAETGRLARSLLLAGLIVVIGGALFSHRIARGALRPLHDAALTAERVTQSSLSARVPYQGPRDDVGMLVESLNSMLDRLETAFAEQRRFVADASHEMRTPLTVMQGHLDVMRAGGRLTDEQEDTLDLVMDELGRTSRLVSDLLSLARLERGLSPLFQSIDVSEVAEEAMVRAQGLGERRFVFSHGGRLPVNGNRDLILETLLNLLSNAVAHTRDKGCITVTSRGRAGWAHIDVADDGPGVPEKDLDRIFDRFYRAPGLPRAEGGGGSGLGLPIARRLMQLHGGKITARNAPGGGAVFSLQFPLQKEGSLS